MRLWGLKSIGKLLLLLFCLNCGPCRWDLVSYLGRCPRIQADLKCSMPINLQSSWRESSPPPRRAVHLCMQRHQNPWIASGGRTRKTSSRRPAYRATDKHVRSKLEQPWFVWYEWEWEWWGDGFRESCKGNFVACTAYFEFGWRIGPLGLWMGRFEQH